MSSLVKALRYFFFIRFSLEKGLEFEPWLDSNCKCVKNELIVSLFVTKVKYFNCWLSALYFAKKFGNYEPWPVCLSATAGYPAPRSAGREGCEARHHQGGGGQEEEGGGEEEEGRENKPLRAVLRIRDFLSRPLIFTHPGYRIQKLQQKRGIKKLLSYLFFIVTNFTKLKIILFFKCKRKNLGQFSKNYRTVYSKNCHYALKNMGLGSRGQKAADPGSWIRIRNTALR